jgi:hypothetical protein
MNKIAGLAGSKFSRDEIMKGAIDEFIIALTRVKEKI